MIGYEFSIESPVHYMLTGKFKSPSSTWQHEQFPLADYELFVVTEGCLYIGDANGKYKVHAGEQLLLSPTPNNVRYGYQASQCSFYWLHFTVSHPIRLVHSSNLPIFSDTKLFIPVQVSLSSPEKIVILMKQLQDSIRHNYNHSFENYITTTILWEIHNQFILPQLTLSADTKSKCQVYNDILDYVHLKLAQNIKVSDIAKHFGYNEKYLSHLFKDVAGMPLKQYILHKKINQAKFLLTDTNHTVHAISSSLCFSDHHYFMKLFKQKVGLTPSEYRNAFSKRLLYDK
jgi:AraC-like DNA-binding protein